MQDADLDFLKECTNEELEFLVQLLVNIGGKSCNLCDTANFKLYHPDHQKYVNEIIDEIQRYAGWSLLTFFSGHGEPYMSALRQTLHILSVGVDKDMERPQLEFNLLEFGKKRYLQRIKNVASRERMATIFNECKMDDGLPIGKWDDGRGLWAEFVNIVSHHNPLAWGFPAARVVTPAVLYIASLRKKHIEAKRAEEGI